MSSNELPGADITHLAPNAWLCHKDVFMEMVAREGSCVFGAVSKKSREEEKGGLNFSQEGSKQQEKTQIPQRKSWKSLSPLVL